MLTPNERAQIAADHAHCKEELRKLAGKTDPRSKARIRQLQIRKAALELQYKNRNAVDPVLGDMVAVDLGPTEWPAS